MAKTPDLTKLKHLMVPSTLHFYYETQDDGTNVLRHIRVNQRTFDVPADGSVTVDIVPPNSVGSEQIVNNSVQMEDLDPRMMTTTQEARDIVAAAIAKEE